MSKAATKAATKPAHSLAEQEARIRRAQPPAEPDEVIEARQKAQAEWRAEQRQREEQAQTPFEEALGVLENFKCEPGLIHRNQKRLREKIAELRTLWEAAKQYQVCANPRCLKPAWFRTDIQGRYRRSKYCRSSCGSRLAAQRYRDRKKATVKP